MPISSYQEMAAASNWYPCPPSLLPFDFIDYGEVLQVSWTYRSLTLTEGRPDLSGVHLTRVYVHVPGLANVFVAQPSLTRLAVRQSVLTALAFEPS